MDSGDAVNMGLNYGQVESDLIMARVSTNVLPMSDFHQKYPILRFCRIFHPQEP